MTDNDIINSLDNCENHKWILAECNGEYVRVGHVIDIINRQKAEIEYWKKNAFNGCMERERIYKAAYKEFAKRLIEIGKQDGAYDYVSLCDIDRLLKEMIGEN